MEDKLFNKKKDGKKKASNHTTEVKLTLEEQLFLSNEAKELQQQKSSSLSSSCTIC